MAIMVAMACGLSVVTAYAQSGQRQSRTAQPTAYNYSSYDYYAADDGASPSDKPMTPAPMTPAAETPAAPAGGCEAPAADAPADNGCHCCRCEPCWSKGLTCCSEDAWRLFDDKCWFKCNDITLDGWIEGGYTYNADGKGATFNGPVLFNDRADEPQLNQLYVRLNKKVETDKCCWQWGYNVDFMYGTDSRFTKATGLELNSDNTDRWNSERFYQISMPQLYAEFARCNWDIKIGRFYTPAGYEVVTAPDNFFYSHSYMFAYAEPFTHTGALVTRKVNDQFTWLAGYQRGWDQWEDLDGEEGSGFILGGLFNSCDNKRKFALTYIEGLEPAQVAANANGGVFATQTGTRNLFTGVYTIQIGDRFTIVEQGDYGWQAHTADGGRSTGQWYGASTYAMYQLNCCWWGGVRAEIFRDDDGTRVSQTTSGNDAAGPFEGDFTEVTLGLNYKPNSGKNLIVRPELRWDHYDGAPGSPLPFDHGTKDDQFLAAFDAIFKY